MFILIIRRAFIVIALFYTILLATVNYFIIPKVVVPSVKSFIESNADQDIRLSVQEIGFSPYKGFLLKDIKITAKARDVVKEVVSSKYVDIDIDWLGLLKKKIQINNLKFENAVIEINRDVSGIWNIEAFLNLQNIGKDSKFKFVFKKISFIKSKINYSDLFVPQDSIKRNFNDIDVVIILLSKFVNKVIVRSRPSLENSELVSVNFDYNKNTQFIKGTLDIDTVYLSEYWNYYLDTFLKPWILDAKKTKIGVNFSYSQDRLLLNGNCKISSGRIAYGDVNITGDALIKQDLLFVFNKAQENLSKTDLILENAYLYAGRNCLMNNIYLIGFLSQKIISVGKLSGFILDMPADLRGEFSLEEPFGFKLSGKVGSFDSDMSLNPAKDNQSIFNFDMTSGKSFLKLQGGFSDFKNLIFNLGVSGDLDLALLLPQPKKKSRNIKFNKADNFDHSLKLQSGYKDNIKLTANLNGEIDEFDTLSGNLLITSDGLNLLGVDTGPLTINGNVGKGIIILGSKDIPFYKGSLNLNFKANENYYGLQLNFNSVDVEDLFAERGQLSGLKGKLNGNISFCRNLRKLKDFKGGGYLRVLNCDLRDASLFKTAEEGIGTIKKDFKMPNFKKIEGNFSFDNNLIKLENFSFKSDTVNLTVKGNLFFSGELDLDLGVKLYGQDFLRTVRQIFIPYTIGFDVLTDSVYVKVQGKWPDFKQKTKVQPMRWLDSFLNPDSVIKSDRYLVENICGR